MSKKTTEQQNETTAEQKNEVASPASHTLVNDGACVIHFGGKRVMPGESFEVDADALKNQGIVYSICRGELSVKGNPDLTKQIKEEAYSKRSKDPYEGKTLKELEDGGEI